MVIFYSLTTKGITRTEDNTMIPILPLNKTFDEKTEYYRTQNTGFVSIPYEMGMFIFNFQLCFDGDGNFIGLEPKAAQ